jgi:hypothetical protein
MSKKMQNLQQALKSSTVAPAANRPEQPEPSAPVVNGKWQGKSTQPSRRGKENIGAWLHPDFKKSLRLAQLRQDGKVYLDDLIAEALNDLFIKYDVPTVRHE